MSSDDIRGVVVPILTPLNDNETIDAVSLRRLVNYLIDNGAHGIWAGGTTGEFAALTDQQRIHSIDTIVDEVDGRVPVIGNVSAPGTELAVTLGRALQESGLDGIAATPPYYYSCSQDELLDHYRRIRDNVGLNLWVYNIPITVKTVVEPSTIAQLAGEGVVVGIKDSSGAGELLAELNVLCDQRDLSLYRFLGTVWRIASTVGVGGHGVIPGIANLVPGIVVDAWEAGQRGDQKAVREHNAKLLSATKVMRLGHTGSSNASSYSGMKSALALMGIIDHDTITRPLRQLTEREKAPIPALLVDLGLMSGT